MSFILQSDLVKLNLLTKYYLSVHPTKASMFLTVAHCSVLWKNFMGINETTAVFTQSFLGGT